MELLGEIIRFFSLKELFAFKHTSKKMNNQLLPIGLPLSKSTSIAVLGNIFNDLYNKNSLSLLRKENVLYTFCFVECSFTIITTNSIS